VVAKSQERKTQAELIEDLSSIEGCTLFDLEIDEGDNAASSSAAPAKKVLDEKSVLSAIGAYYPKIADIVSQYEASLSSDQRAAALHQLGRKVGGGIYQRDYALGSPLKMPKTISRELVPALKGLSKVKAKDNIIYLIKCPFCESSDHNHSGCHFVVGYIEGFLASNPAVDMIQVEETNCGAGSTNICEFTIR
jgi:predicted hydrocarbon binding protein